MRRNLLKLVDEDTLAFNKIMFAMNLSKASEEEIFTRNKAIEDATIYAIEVPYKVMTIAYESMVIIKTIAETGNPNSVSDAGVGALCARTAVLGAFMNVRINASGMAGDSRISEILRKGKEISELTIKLEEEILKIVDSKIER